MSYPPLSDLLSQMKGMPSTNKWDVICSYTIIQLNQFLKTQYEANKLAKHVQLSTDREDPLTGEAFTITYDIQFDSPKLAFTSGRSGFTTLTMPIVNDSSYSVSPKGSSQARKVSIPGGVYSIEAIVPLAAMNGDTGEVVEADNLITFSDGKVHDNHVIIHFKNEKGAAYKLIPDPDPKDKDPLVTYFLPVLTQYFQTEVDEIDYALATVNNIVPDTGTTLLTPKSFVFHSAADDDNTDGVLSLYIQTAESGNPPGDATPSFQPSGSSQFPIPEGQTASIILSHALITKAYLQAQLTNSGYNVTFNAPSDGISVTLKKDVSVISDGDSGTYIFGGHSYDGLQINLNDYPLTLTIKDSQLSLQWEGKATSSWSEYTLGSNGGNWGKVDLTIEMHKSAALTLTKEDVIGGELSVDRQDYAITIKSHSCSFWESLNHCREDYPSYYSNDMVLTIPAIQIAFAGLNFFNTTNLVSPGQTVIELDTTTGVQTPHDFLIVGKVTAK